MRILHCNLQHIGLHCWDDHIKDDVTDMYRNINSKTDDTHVPGKIIFKCLFKKSRVTVSQRWPLLDMIMNLHVQRKVISCDQLGAYQLLKKISACWTSLSQIAV